MGHVIVEAELVGRRRRRVPMLVDTGATYAVLPADLASAVGIVLLPRRETVTPADGRRRRMRVGAVHVRVAGREAAALALVAPRGSEPLLGVEALEAMGLAVDPRSRKLKPTRAHGVLLVGVRKR